MCQKSIKNFIGSSALPFPLSTFESPPASPTLQVAWCLISCSYSEAGSAAIREADWFMSYFQNSWTVTFIFDSLMTWAVQTAELFLGPQAASCYYHALVIMKFLSPNLHRISAIHQYPPIHRICSDFLL